MAEYKDDSFTFLCSIYLLLNVRRVVIFMSQLMVGRVVCFAPL